MIKIFIFLFFVYAFGFWAKYSGKKTKKTPSFVLARNIFEKEKINAMNELQAYYFFKDSKITTPEIKEYLIKSNFSFLEATKICKKINKERGFDILPNNIHNKNKGRMLVIKIKKTLQKHGFFI